jgi:cytochrome b6-f complex iron-sulfur subunit
MDQHFRAPEDPAGSPGVPEKMTRRGLMNAALGGSLLAWIAAVLFPILKYLTPPKDAGGASKLTLDDAQKQELAGKGLLIARMGTDRVLMFKDPDGKLRALSAKCTHEGCTVQYAASEAIISCACHNGRFTLDGRVISGPPPRPLTPFVVEGDLAGVVSVVRASGTAS